MVLRKVAAEKSRQLVLFRGHLNQAGFVSQLKSMLSELDVYKRQGEGAGCDFRGKNQ